MTNNISIVKTDGFKFARGFQMPDDRQFEEQSKPWVSWGKKNLFPNFLNNIFYSSAYQSGIIRSKVNYIVGSGYVATNEDALGLGDYKLQDIIDYIAKDYELYNAFAIRVKRNLDGEKYYEFVDFDHLRVDKEYKGWWYSEDWSKDKQDLELTGLRFLPNHERNNEEQYDSVYVCMDGAKNPQTKTSKKGEVQFYPQPIYIGALKALMTDIEVQSFHLYNVINGMKMGGMLVFKNGEPENKTQFEQSVQDAITPSENSGGVMIAYSDGDDRIPEFIPFSGDDLDKRYNLVEKSIVQNIMSAHCATSPMLFGIQREGMQVGEGDLRVAEQIFIRTYVRNRQKTIEEHLSYLFNSITEITLNEPEPVFGKGEGEGVKGDAPSLQETALNGAQISSLMLVIERYNEGIIDRDSAISIITSAFPSVPLEKAEGMISEQSASEKFSDKENIEDKILSSFAKIGRSKSEYKVLTRNDIHDEFDFDSEEVNIKANFFKGEFEITPIDARILDLVRKGESIDAIQEALPEDKKVIQKAYANLVGKGFIKDGDVTNSGIRELAKNQPDFTTEVLYSYEKRPDAPPLKGESREFCSTLLGLNRLYTRQEIDLISGEVDRNVWRYRGGWYSDPTKPHPTPFCRHVWAQNLTVKR